jgi:acyl-coenzyme A synthetase/AMP-(fatty) acid ligase
MTPVGGDVLQRPAATKLSRRYRYPQSAVTFVITHADSASASLILACSKRRRSSSPKPSAAARRRTESARGRIEPARSPLRTVPRDVEFVADLPRTSTGKVQKFQLRRGDWGERSSHAP